MAGTAERRRRCARRRARAADDGRAEIESRTIAAAGVRVAPAQRGAALARAAAIDPPVVVKPDGEDNSIGLTLVRDRAEIGAALETAFKFDDVALVEAFVPGREVRVGVIDDGNSAGVASVRILRHRSASDPGAR